MKDQYKTKKKLMDELEGLRQQVDKLKRVETKHKRAEEVLRESEQRYRSLFANSMDAVLLTSPDGAILEANAEACRMLGYTEEELYQIGRDGVVDASDPRLPMALEERGRAGEFRGGLNLKRKDGTKFPAEISSAVFRDKDGNLRTTMIIRDITERNRGEEALRESEQKYAHLFENLSDAAFLADVETGRIIEANKQAEILLGRNRDEIITMPQMDLHPPGKSKGYREMFAGHAEKGLSVDYDAQVIRKDGSLVDVCISRVPIVIGCRKLLLALFRDITERKRAENVLKESEARYRRLVENSPAIVWSFSDRRGTLFVSSRVKSILGYSPDFLCANPWLWNRSIHPDDQCLVAQAIKDFASGKDIRVEYRIKDSSENWLWFHDRSIGRYEEGEEVIIEGISIDITERRRTREALRESNEFNKQIIAGAREGIFVMDRDLRVAMWNPWMEQISGLKEDQTLGKKNSELFPFVRETGLDSLMERALAGENIPPLDHIYHIPQTNRRGWASTRYSPLHNTEGEIIGVIAMVTDITERKRAEGVLRENEVRFREMFENMGSGVAIYKVINDGEDFVFTDINPAGARIGQRSREETVGKSVQEVYPGVRDLGLFDVFKRVWRTGRPERHPAEQYQDDRLTIWVENYVCKLPSGEIVAIYEDITEQKKAEREREHLFQEVKSNREQLKSLSHRLVQAQEAERHHLVRKLHDEVGQELTALSLNLNIVRSQLPSTIAAKLTNRIDDSLNLLEKTFERVRDLMAELRPPVLDDYGLTAALHWYGKQFSDRTGISPLLQLKELSPRLPLPVETALLRIAQEALTNVSKYAQAKHIILTLDEVGGEVDLTIADDGVGFDPTVDRQPGSRPAWGLINSRERAQAVGGTLQVKTAPGKGTKIMVKVPINH